LLDQPPAMPLCRQWEWLTITKIIVSLNNPFFIKGK
jgi:hypothetical protein